MTELARARPHWHYVPAQDAGWPIAGELRVALDENDRQLIGPDSLWQAATVTVGG